MADRLAVMNEGRIEQVGTPREVYEEPASAYVADFLGVSNLLDAQAIGEIPTAGAGSGSGTSSCSPPAVTPRPGGRSRWWCAPSGCVWRPPGRPARTGCRGRSNASSTPAPSPSSWSPSTAGAPIRCMLANDGVGSSFDRGAPVSVYLPCEALRVLRTETTETQRGGKRSIPVVSAQATTNPEARACQGRFANRRITDPTARNLPRRSLLRLPSCGNGASPGWRSLWPAWRRRGVCWPGRSGPGSGPPARRCRA